MSTAPRRYASLMLGRSVEEFIAERKDGANETYVAIAQAIKDATDGVVDVTPEAVRQWHAAYVLTQQPSDVA